MKTAGLLLLWMGVSGIALARICPGGNCTVPEIDPSLAGSGLALLSGGALMIMSRRKK